MTDVPEADFDVEKEGQVEIIGWLYQYYNEEPHNQVVNINGGPVKKNDIPAATQLFTTDWVVRYMVDNSLGRFYLEHNEDSTIADKLEYLLPGKLVQSEDTVELKNIKVLDNAMGSGHILVYAFDVLMEMYLEQGYSKRDAAVGIIENNLYGLEIDRRAYQLAYFALMMKLRQYNRRALTMEIMPNIYVFEDTDDITAEDINSWNISEPAKKDLAEIANKFSNARTLGSIVKLNRSFDTSSLKKELSNAISKTDLDVFGIDGKINILSNTLNIVQIFQTKFEVIVTNPPYLNHMDKSLKAYVKKNYKAYCGDMFSIFIWMNINMTTTDGYAAYMTPMVWMFIKTFQKLRESIIDNFEISSLIQMETHAFFDEAFVTIDSFVLKNTVNHSNGIYLRLTDFKGGMEVQGQKVTEAIKYPSVGYVYRTNQANFSKIPGSPIAYWASDNLIHDFEIGTPMSKLVEPRQGLATADNNRFLRQWFEVTYSEIKFDAKSISDSVKSKKKWFPYNKGGAYRKWYGNYDYVVNWQNDGYEIRNFKDHNGKVKSRPQNTSFYFREAITWSGITSGHFSIRYRAASSIHADKGMSAFARGQNRDILFYSLAALNTKLGDLIFEILNPTVSLQVGDVGRFPLIVSRKDKLQIQQLVYKNISIAKDDWNILEIAWDFDNSPLISNIDEHKQPPP